MTVKFNVKGSDPSKAISGGGEQAPVGMYLAKIVKVTDRSSNGSGKNDLEVIYEITANADGSKLKEQYAQVYEYVNFGVDWKLDQFLQAIGAATSTKREGSFDETKQAGKKVKIRIKGETYNDEYRAKCGGVWKATAGPSAGAEDEPDDEEEETSAASDAEETWADVGAKIDNEEDIDPDEITAAAEEAGLDPDDYDTWEALGAELDAGDAAEPAEEEAEEEAAEEGEEDVPYSEWSLAELREECTARELDDTGAKSKLVARLEEDDENAGPFDE